MFREMRRSDRQISGEEALKLLEEAQFGVLSTVGENGYGYGVPLNYVYYDEKIYFHCAQEGSKLDNIAYNDKVSFCVIGECEPVPDKFTYNYISAIAFGRCAEVSGEEKEEALLAIIKKYSSEFLEQGIKYIKKDIDVTKIFKINIEHFTGKARR